MFVGWSPCDPFLWNDAKLWIRWLKVRLYLLHCVMLIRKSWPYFYKNGTYLKNSMLLVKVEHEALQKGQIVRSQCLQVLESHLLTVVHADSMEGVTDRNIHCPCWTVCVMSNTGWLWHNSLLHFCFILHSEFYCNALQKVMSQGSWRWYSHIEIFGNVCGGNIVVFERKLH